MISVLAEKFGGLSGLVANVLVDTEGKTNSRQNTNDDTGNGAAAKTTFRRRSLLGGLRRGASSRVGCRTSSRVGCRTSRGTGCGARSRVRCRTRGRDGSRSTMGKVIIKYLTKTRAKKLKLTKKVPGSWVRSRRASRFKRRGRRRLHSRLLRWRSGRSSRWDTRRDPRGNTRRHTRGNAAE